MRIDPKTTTVSPVSSKSLRDVQTPSVKRDANEDSATKVELSRAGAAASSAGVDGPSGTSSEKLSRLRMQIEKGDYRPDLDLLASRLVEDGLVGDVA